MSFAAAQHDKFMDQVAAERRAFTFTDGGELLVYRVASGEVVPFWSSRSRLVTIQKRAPKYQQWTITEFTLDEFLTKLDVLERQAVNVGVNWSGERLAGYNVNVASVRAALQYRLQRLAK